MFFLETYIYIYICSILELGNELTWKRKVDSFKNPWIDPLAPSQGKSMFPNFTQIQQAIKQLCGVTEKTGTEIILTQISVIF